ncbi:MarC family protein [Roseicella sp. DB1501]|uniref:MarC family protein n=1 Tax=Roseicella sp. DB1501 TaxID=2730925 RepID=UPI001490DE66|nr:MarC family protein [Roseicella sp. DB1501]NOG72003.1 NAAT family transporter [Roseicella sp. DB1501]
MRELSAATESFLLAFPALFSIVNPIAAALIYADVTARLRHADRVRLAARIAAYSAVVLLSALWTGAYVLGFFGISLAALRIAGGLVVAVRAWDMLAAPERTEERKQDQASKAEGEPPGDIAFFPLTMPFTTGPGSISVAVALGANRPVGSPGGGWAEVAPFAAGLSLAALAVAGLVWLAYRSADALVGLLGQSRARILTRLAAFLMLCIGVQIVLSGVTEALRPLLAR